ncbi:MAG: c-type cytochrome [Flavobacteriales bacterium]|nr:c-type cytochrome [Flavobacteriales bacterium]
MKRLLSSLALTLLTSFFLAGDYANGELIFNAKCASCHYPTEEINAAPGLAGVTERWAGKEELLYLWIKNPNAAIATGDPYVTGLVNEYKARFGLMAAQNVNDTEIEDILTYINEYVPPVVSEEVVAVQGGGEESEDQGMSWMWWLVFGLIFIAVIFSLSGVKRQLEVAEAIKEGRSPEEIGYGEAMKAWMWDNRTLVSIIGIFVMVLLIVAAWDWAARIGVYGGEDVVENYKPDQPIKFSHALHAGENQIECQYCHSTAQKSKTPLIPSANVCMNCHKYIKEGPKYGKDEIAKIYQAIGWDVENFVYTGDTEPIEWIKVHDLPDHVYFNHAQHVKVAGLECETCHGQVDEMEVVEQVSSLTMGWCINCHNETSVTQMTASGSENGYYDEIHARMVSTDQGVELLREYLEDGAITAKELGGWECSKCHY